MAFSLGEYQDIFLEEADEQVQELNQNLLELEKNPDDIDIINNIFRAAHSLKSSSAFVGLNDLSDLAHKMENLLQGLRDGTLNINPNIIDVIFKCFDEINAVIDTISAGEKPTQDLTWIIDEIQSVYAEAKTGESPEKSEVIQDDSDDGEIEIPETTLDTKELKEIKEGLQSENSCSEITVFIDKSAQLKWVKAQLILNNMEGLGRIVKSIPSSEELNDDTMNNIFKVILLTNSSIDEIKNACDIDLITRVDIKRLSLKKKDKKLVLKFSESETIIEEGGKPEEISVPSEKKDEDIAEEDVYVEFDDEDGVEEYDEIESGIGRSQKMTDGPAEPDKRKVAVLKTVKVSVDKLDQLLNNVGELVIANSGFYKLYEEIRKISSEKSVSNEFKSRIEQMASIAKALQTGIMKTRMVQIGQVFSRFNRLVRDISKGTDKSIELIIKGEETEMDKKVIDAISEPLMHLIRNAVDHGIETVEERNKLGKSEIAHITLNSYQGGNHIFIEVSDDGRGLDSERIKAKVIESGLVTAENLLNMDDSEIYNFIFNPGFSTADKVTDISGRGVGMNVVREVVEELSGNISIETEVGMGTRFVLTFPLTLAIIPAIMVKVSNEIYAIPLSDVIETVKISQSDISTIEGSEVINLRGEILSLLRLNNFVGVESSLDFEQKVPVVVVGFGSRKVGLIVDYLEAKQEIVIKSLEQNYKTVEGLAGASVLGDGSIVLILDINSMINMVISQPEKLKKYEKPPTRVVEEEIKVIQEKEEPSDFMEREISKEIAEAEESIKDTGEKIEDAGEDIDEKVHAALTDFRKELKENIQSTLDSAKPGEEIEDSLNIVKADLNEFQVIANIGATDSAESLSKILNRRIDLSIPEVSIQHIENIPEYIGDIGSTYFGIMMPVQGDVKGILLLMLKEDIGFELVNMIYGRSDREKKQLNEDEESALIEITNILGSSIVNVIAEKTGLTCKTTVPTIVHDYMESIVDSILVVQNISNDYTLVMDTAFFFEDDTVIGNLFLIPEAESLKIIIDQLKSDVRKN